MDMKIRALSSGHNVRISIIDLTETMQRINKLQKTNPVTATLLSQFTIATALLGMEFKGDGKMFADWTTEDGSIQNMKAMFFDNDKVGSFIRVPDCELDEQGIANALGTIGTLSMEYSNKMGDPYMSRVDIDADGIDQTFNNYIKDSNQVGAILLTSIKINEKTLAQDKVAGILIQLLPGHGEDDINFLEKKLGSGTKHLNRVLQGTTNYDSLIKDIVEDAIILESKELHFGCTCSKEKMMNAIKMVDQETLIEMYESKENSEVVCEFCKTIYVITPDDLKTLIN